MKGFTDGVVGFEVLVPDQILSGCLSVWAVGLGTVPLLGTGW